MTQKKLVLVDDDQIFVYLTAKSIEQTKLIDLIKIFDNGLDAINFLKEKSGEPQSLPEVILLDLSMPIMDGWQFLEEYILLQPRLTKKITIYIVSSSITPSDIMRAKNISAVSDYIIKPVTKEKLIELVKQL